jgi:protein SCO1/2
VKLISSFILVLGSAIAGAQQFLQGGGATGPPINQASVHVVQKLGGQVPMTATFRDTAGNEVPFSQLDSQRPVILLPLFYRCHGVCSLEFESLISTLNKLKTDQVGRDYDVVILGIDPTEGSDLAKGKFEEAQKEFPTLMSSTGWHFLTGDLKTFAPSPMLWASTSLTIPRRT